MPEPVALRRAGPADLGAIIGLRMDFERITRDSGSLDEASRRAELAALLGPDMASGRLFCWLAEDGDRAVAQAALRLLSRGEGEILNVYTATAYRRRGIGGGLVALALGQARTLGLSRIRLQPTDDSRRIYARAGFRSAGRAMILDLERATGVYSALVATAGRPGRRP
jgi:predicted GNAT family acetyltransferase